MNAAELRIGNWVYRQRGKGPQRAGERSQPYKLDKVILQQASWWDPIQITSDLLRKLELFDCQYKPYSIGIYSLELKFSISIKCGDNKVIVKVNGRVINEIQYVHQFQNIFFAITGKELEIKEEFL